MLKFGFVIPTKMVMRVAYVLEKLCIGTKRVFPECGFFDLYGRRMKHMQKLNHGVCFKEDVYSTR